MIQPLMTLAEVADWRRIKPDRFSRIWRQMVEKGDLPAPVYGADGECRPLWHRPSLDAFAAKRSTKTGRAGRPQKPANDADGLHAERARVRAALRG